MGSEFLTNQNSRNLPLVPRQNHAIISQRRIQPQYRVASQGDLSSQYTLSSFVNCIEYRRYGRVEKGAVCVGHNSLPWQILVHQNVVWPLPRCEDP